LSYAKLAHVFHWPVWHASSPVTDLSAWLAAAAIVAPFLASYALGQITIRDCRRRVSRYKKMSAYLISLARTLNTCRANGSRLRIIEQAERMLIEEHHEWISVTRNYSV
jgi:hypothetical protein